MVIINLSANLLTYLVTPAAMDDAKQRSSFVKAKTKTKTTNRPTTYKLTKQSTIKQNIKKKVAAQPLSKN